jgi:1-phosphatidylinositol phosphodiesterase
MTLDLSNWMSRLANSLKLSDLSIPGTHDSGARYPASEPDRLTTQTRSVREQLDNGIRFLDIRVRFTNGKFSLVHESTLLYEHEVAAGETPVVLHFGAVRDMCKEFLAAHPRETIIMSLKPDADPEGDQGGVSFQQRFNEYVANDPGLWYLENRIPALAEVRGKIVLFRRFAIAANTTLGINAVAFQSNTFVINGPPTLKIQDQFDQTTTTRAAKFSAVKGLLDDALRTENGPEVLYVNFVSAAGILNNDIDDDFPDAVAKDINPDVRRYFQDPLHAKGRFGIVVTDFEKTELNTLIAGTNYFDDAGYWTAYDNARVEGNGFASPYPAAGARATSAVAIAAAPDGQGYYLLARDGTVRAYGKARFVDDGVAHGTEAVAIAVTPAPVDRTRPGYWILARNGKVRAYNAVDHGEIERGTNLQAVSIVATPDGGGYWILASNGRIHVFGNASQLGDRRDSDQVTVAMASTPAGDGYWILASNGAVNRFGNAVNYSQGLRTNSPARAIAAAKDGRGYWILLQDGSIEAFGSAPNLGSLIPDTPAPPQAVGIATDLFSPQA